jgi:hypothetical protein
MRNMWYWIQRFPGALRRAVRYFRIGYQSGDWDYYYLIELMALKLREMEKVWETPYYVGQEKDEKRIREARILCERIMKSEIPTKTYFDSRFHGKVAFKMNERELDRLCVVMRHALKWWY